MNDDDLPDLLAWRVPQPPELDAHALVQRALTPATGPVRRPRLRWVVATLVVTNAVIAALLVIVLARPAARPAAVVLPAGDASSDLRVQQLLARLATEQAQLEGRLADLEEMRALVKELQAQVDLCEHAHTVPKPPPTPVIAPTPVAPVIDTSCDEVSCVLDDYAGACCKKLEKTPPVPPPPGMPDALDRTAISNGVASVKASVAACATTAPAKGIVKVRVRVGANGLVTNVDIVETPDARLADCIATAVQHAVFPRTKQGGSFSYPFVF